MKLTKTKRTASTRCGLAAVALVTLAMTGCQVNVGGQTLPSGYYLTDDIQYFAPGPEFSLENEAAAMKAAKQEAAELDRIQ